MRNATSRDLVTAVIGSKESVGIQPGTVVDLDRVIGDEVVEREQRADDGTVMKKAVVRPFTVADALGPELLTHFDIIAPPAPVRRGRESAEAPVAPREE